MATLAGKTLFVTGASRGIGREIALRAARDGANVAIAAKTTEPHPKLKGTIHTVAAEIEAAGGKALAIALDVRDEDAIARAVAQAAGAFGGLDILVNNASAINLTPTLQTPAKRFDLMMAVNARATFLCAQACIPQLLRSDNPHILTLAPPPVTAARWYGAHLAYTLAKGGMSWVTLGLAEEFRAQGLAVNALWPRTVIATSAIRLLPGVDPARCRKPEIVADAAHAILTRPARSCTGRFFLDEEALAEAGITDFDAYAVTPGAALLPDIFLD